MSRNPYTHGLFWQALNGISQGQETPDALTKQLRAALLALGSETPDNLNCADRIEIGAADGEIGPVLCGYPLSEIAHRLEDEPMPEALRAALPKMAERDWDAFMRLTTLLYIALSRP